MPVTLSSVRVAEMAKALGHPARVKIVRMLAQDGPQLAGDITAALGLAQSTVSAHLRVLRTAGAVISRREGSRTRYRVSNEALCALAWAIAELASAPS